MGFILIANWYIHTYISAPYFIIVYDTKVGALWCPWLKMQVYIHWYFGFRAPSTKYIGMLSCAPKPMSRFIDARNLNYILSYLQGQPGSLTQFQISWVAWLVYVWHLIWQFSCVPPPKFGMLLIRFPPWWAHLTHRSQSLLISPLVTVTARHIIP